MARPTKYNWEAIREAYEGGFSKDEIVKKYRVAKSLLTNKINGQKWVIKSDINAELQEFNDGLDKIAQNSIKHQENLEILEERINTQIEDNIIIGNNRKLTKAFQNLVGKGIKSGIYKTPQDIKAGASTIRDFEAISNPTVKPDIAIQNNNNNEQKTNDIKIVVE